MKAPADKQDDATDHASDDSLPTKRRAYVTPRIEQRRAVERVTLLSGMGAMSVGAVNMMN